VKKRGEEKEYGKGREVFPKKADFLTLQKDACFPWRGQNETQEGKGVSGHRWRGGKGGGGESPILVYATGIERVARPFLSYYYVRVKRTPIQIRKRRHHRKKGLISLLSGEKRKRGIVLRSRTPGGKGGERMKGKRKGSIRL